MTDTAVKVVYSQPYVNSRGPHPRLYLLTPSSGQYDRLTTRSAEDFRVWVRQWMEAARKERGKNGESHGYQISVLMPIYYCNPSELWRFFFETTDHVSRDADLVHSVILVRGILNYRRDYFLRIYEATRIAGSFPCFLSSKVIYEDWPPYTDGDLLRNAQTYCAAEYFSRLAFGRWRVARRVAYAPTSALKAILSLIFFRYIWKTDKVLFVAIPCNLYIEARTLWNSLTTQWHWRPWKRNAI